MPLDPAMPVLGDSPRGNGAAGDGVPGDLSADGILDVGISGDGMSGDGMSGVRDTVARQWRDRRALERRLHDGAALRISALTLRLGLLRHERARGDEEFDAAVELLQDELHLVLQELRDVEGMLYPPLLDEAGLGPALREAAARCLVAVHVDAVEERFGAAAEGAAYFAVLACLPLDGRDRGGRVDVVIRRDGDALGLLVTGVDACHAGTVRDGVRLLGGTVVVAGSAGAPMTVRIPCA